MKALAKYDVEIQGLKLEKYVYEYESGGEFFEALTQDLIKSGQFKTILSLEKTATMVVLDFQIAGFAQLVCDRSLEEFEGPIELKERLILKFGDHNEELSDEIMLVKQDTPRINVAQTIFDFIALSLPMKRLHPRFRSQDDDIDVEGLLVFSSERDPAFDDDNDEPNTEAPQPSTDPRWEALKKLKN